MLGWLPFPSIRGYVALILLLAVGLTSSFLLRNASVKHLHYVAMPNALLIFLQEPVGVSQSKIEGEITRILADQPARKGHIPLFYVLSKKYALHHFLIDSGIRDSALTSSKLPDGSWYLIAASASYCGSPT
jgi:hypothetical protein